MKNTPTPAGPYNAGTAVYRDNDNNGTVTPGDLRITPAGAFAAGSVVAAGNADAGTVIRMFSMFGTVRVPNSAKDTVEVANISSNTNVPDVSTSRGPTADGRLKPDIAGPGWQSGGDGGVTSTYPPSGYFSLTGTSMATPAVAGSAALLTEWYSAACVAGGPTPDALRAILIHAAEDKTAIPATTGTFTGPDYVFGYGRTRIKDAVDLLGHHRQGSFAAAASQDTPITIGRVQPLKVTLAWDDPPHTGSAAPSAAIGLLQNDLDLLLIAPDGTQYTPWQLNAASPASPATSTATPSAMPIPAAAVDHRNTVEQVVVPNAMPGNWTIRVTASTLNIPPQGYTLVSEFIPPQSGPCNPAPAVDMFMRDNADDTMGTIPSAGTMWQSPDIWNRLGPDGGTIHLNPVHGIAMPVPNYMYANVRNLTTPTTGKTARVDVWIAAAALGLSWPTDFTYVGSIPVANLNVATQQVGPLVWFPPDPTPSDHFCLYARLQSPQDPITFAETANLDTNARNSNNIIWKNVNIISMSANAAAFQVRNVMKDDRDVDIEVRIDPKFLAAGGTIGAMLSPDLEERWAKRGKAEGFEIHKRPKPPHDPRLDVDRPDASTIEFHAKNERAAIRGIPMKGREAAPARMTFTLGNEPKDADEYKVEVIEMIDGKEVGGIAYILRPGDHK